MGKGKMDTGRKIACILTKRVFLPILSGGFTGVLLWVLFFFIIWWWEGYPYEGARPQFWEDLWMFIFIGAALGIFVGCITGILARGRFGQNWKKIILSVIAMVTLGTILFWLFAIAQ